MDLIQGNVLPKVVVIFLASFYNDIFLKFLLWEKNLKHSNSMSDT